MHETRAKIAAGAVNPFADPAEFNGYPGRLEKAFYEGSAKQQAASTK